MSDRQASAFDAFGQQHARAPRYVSRTGKAPRVPETDAEKRQTEHDARYRRYRRLIEAERKEAYALPGGADAYEVVKWAKRHMGLEDGDTLLSKVRRLQPEQMDKRLRWRLLRDLGEAIYRLKLRNGMHDDDPLPGDPDTVSIVLRRILGDRPEQEAIEADRALAKAWGRG